MRFLFNVLISYRAQKTLTHIFTLSVNISIFEFYLNRNPTSDLTTDLMSDPTSNLTSNPICDPTSDSTSNSILDPIFDLNFIVTFN